MLQNGTIQQIRNMSAAEIAQIRAGGKSVEELVGVYLVLFGAYCFCEHVFFSLPAQCSLKTDVAEEAASHVSFVRKDL